MILKLFFRLLIGHAISDFALQTEFIATTKGRKNPPKYLDRNHLPMWSYTLTCHALINAGVVLLITSSYFVALLEFLIHWLLDFIKCEGYTNIHWDQMLHIFCKLLYCVILFC